MNSNKHNTREYDGSIRGLVQTAGVLGSTIGAVVFSLSFDVVGTISLSLLGGVAIAASLMVKPPTRHQRWKKVSSGCTSSTGTGAVFRSMTGGVEDISVETRVSTSAAGLRKMKSPPRLPSRCPK